MVRISVPATLLAPIAAASAHALTDLRRPPRELLPYAVALLPLPSPLVTALFLASSHCHFARDVGGALSALLHGALLALAPRRPDLAWAVFALFYCGVHCPAHVARQALTRGEGRALLATAVALGALGALGTLGALGALGARLALGDRAQLVVVGHVLVEEVDAARRRRA